MKDKKEIKNIKNSHIYDGAALTKYLFWLKKNFQKKRLQKLVLQKNYFILEGEIKNLNIRASQLFLARDLTEQLYIIRLQKNLIDY